MASTNKTTNYQLSQFIGTDKPAWLSDYNQDMAKIDSGMKNAADTATAASGAAGSANTSIGTLTDLTTTTKTDLVSAVNEVNLAAAAAQQTANTAGSTATSAETKADNLIRQFNMSILRSPSQLNYAINAGSVSSESSVTVISNTDQTLAKIYGVIRVTSIAGSGDCTITVTNTGLALENTLTINAHGLFTSSISQLQGAGRFSVLSISIVLSNDTMRITFPRNSQITDGNIILGNSLLFLKDFGDVVIPN